MSLHPQARTRLTKWFLLFVVLATIISGITWWRNDQPPIKPQAVPPTSSSSIRSAPASFNRAQYSINDAASVWAVVNKGRVLPNSYVPADLVAPDITLSESAASQNMQLRKDSAASLEKLVSAASNEGLKVKLVSGYRSYATQQSVYSGYVASQGKAYADATSAQPGYSEHQTGLAADLGAASGKCQLQKCFGDMAEGQWLAANAHKYGFIVRYPKDKQSLTGYDYEPWHVRYVGVDLATELNKTGQTLEQFFGLPTYPDYPTTVYQLR